MSHGGYVAGGPNAYDGPLWRPEPKRKKSILVPGKMRRRKSPRRKSRYRRRSA